MPGKESNPSRTDLTVPSVVSVVQSGTGHMELNTPPVSGHPETDLNRVQHRGFQGETGEPGPSAAGNSPETDLNRVQGRGFHRETEGETGPTAPGNSQENVWPRDSEAEGWEEVTEPVVEPAVGLDFYGQDWEEARGEVFGSSSVATGERDFEGFVS